MRYRKYQRPTLKNGRKQLNLIFPIKNFFQIYGKFYDVHKKNLLEYGNSVYSVSLKMR
jgi:hypothetical protein